MMWEWLALAGLTLVALVLLVALLRLRARTRREIAASLAVVDTLRDRLDRMEATPRTRLDAHEYTITSVGHEDGREGEPAPRLERAVFADLLLRESVIRLGSLAHGVRRAVSAESRNRIRFEMKREVKRARKQRRTERREAYREWQARQRDEVDDVGGFRESA